MKYLKTFEELDIKTYQDASFELADMGYKDRADALVRHSIDRMYDEIYNNAEVENIGGEDFSIYSINYPDDYNIIYQVYEDDYNLMIDDGILSVYDSVDITDLRIMYRDVRNLLKKMNIDVKVNRFLTPDDEIDINENVDKMYDDIYNNGQIIETGGEDFVIRYNEYEIVYQIFENDYNLMIGDGILDVYNEADIEDLRVIYSDVKNLLKRMNIDVKVNRFLTSNDEIDVNGVVTEELSTNTYKNAAHKLIELGYKDRGSNMRKEMFERYLEKYWISLSNTPLIDNPNLSYIEYYMKDDDKEHNVFSIRKIYKDGKMVNSLILGFNFFKFSKMLFNVNYDDFYDVMLEFIDEEKYDVIA